MKHFLFFTLFIALTSCSGIIASYSYETEILTVNRLTKNTFIHTSYLQTDDFGKVACNGMIVISDGEALVFETPTDDAGAKELIKYIEGTLKCKVIGVVADHFHTDCLGGLAEFHAQNIPSYAHSLTLELAKRDGVTVPQNGFNDRLELTVGKRVVISEFFGEGHTVDNIVNYVPKDRILFGGCLIKAMDANKGYLGDANPEQWSTTVEAVKANYKKARVVIPGHGDYGGKELLDYTIQLFQPE